MAEGSIGGVTAAAIKYALDGLSVRQTLIASNLANGGTEGYRPMHIDFESQLATALRRLESGRASGDFGPERLPLPPVEYGGASAFGSGENTKADMAVLEMNQTVMKYQSLVEGMNKYMAVMSTAINEGRR